MTEPVNHTVVEGDSFWTLAEKYYGDGSKWKQIAEANPEVTNHGLKIGSVLVIPIPK